MKILISNKFFCLHKYKAGAVKKFATEKMDSYGYISNQLQQYSCEMCGKNIFKAVNENLNTIQKNTQH